MTIFSLLIGLLLIGFVVLGVYFGLFKGVEVKEEVVGPFRLVYKNHQGEYEELSEIQDEIHDFLEKEKGIETYRKFRIYYNDSSTSKENWRSKAGCILEGDDYKKLSGLEGKYEVKQFSKQRVVKAKFPYKSRLSLVIAPFKVYPKIGRYLKTEEYKERESIEVQDELNNKLIYMMPVEKK